VCVRVRVRVRVCVCVCTWKPKVWSSGPLLGSSTYRLCNLRQFTASQSSIVVTSKSLGCSL
jgi:hypothetical protein